MRFFAMAFLLIFLSLGTVPSGATDAIPDKNFERAARAEARRQGWPGYPDSYDEAFIAGARWARGQSKKMMCEPSTPAALETAP